MVLCKKMLICKSKIVGWKYNNLEMSYAFLSWVRAGLKKQTGAKTLHSWHYLTRMDVFYALDYDETLCALYCIKKVLPEFGELAFGDLLLWSFRVAPTKKGGEHFWRSSWIVAKMVAGIFHTCKNHFTLVKTFHTCKSIEYKFKWHYGYLMLMMMMTTKVGCQTICPEGHKF